MKKIFYFLVVLILVFAIIGVGNPVQMIFNQFDEQRQIENSKPTAQERTEFQQQTDDNTYYYYNNLNDVEKEAYVIMYTSFMSFDKSFVMEATVDQVKEVFTSVLYDNPHIFWVSNNYQYLENGNSVSFTPKYRLTDSEAQTITKQLNDKVDEISSSANSLTTDYEKELYIHNYVCENTVYDENTFNAEGDTAYSALLNGKAICEGYSRAVQILLDAVDIDNYLVIGNGITDGKSEPHMWNIVNIDNANYHLDATWNDANDDGSISYFYFNVTDEIISKDHSDIEPLNNFCISNTANYFETENAVVDSYNGFYEHTNRSAETLKGGQNYVEFLFEHSNDFKKAVKDIEKDNGFFKYIASAVRQSGRKLNSYQIEYYTIDNRNYLCIVFKED